MSNFAQTLALAKNGDEVALAGIIACEMPVIRGYAKRVTSYGLEFDDAVQEGIIGLFRAIETFNADKTATFKTYAGVCIRNAVVEAARSATRKKHQVLTNSVPLTEEHCVEGPEQMAIENESYRITVKKINQELSGFEKKVLRLFLQGTSYIDISKKLLCTTKAVDNALSRIRNKLKK